MGKYFALQSTSNRKYLEYVQEHGVVQGLNKFSGENPDPYGKYKIEKAKTGGALVHIKCCYNNKYLVRRAQNLFWITSTANEPEEDKWKWSCTLFEIIPKGGNTIQLRHVQLGQYAGHNVHDSSLILGSKELVKDMCYDFTIHVGDILNDGTYAGVKEEKLVAASDLIEQLASEPI